MSSSNPASTTDPPPPSPPLAALSSWLRSGRDESCSPPPVEEPPGWCYSGPVPREKRTRRRRLTRATAADIEADQTPTRLDHRFFPHIFDLIVLQCGHAALKVLRATSKEFNQRADMQLHKHLVLDYKTIATAHGSAPAMRDYAAARTAPWSLTTMVQIVDFSLSEPMVARPYQPIDSFVTLRSLKPRVVRLQPSNYLYWPKPLDSPKTLVVFLDTKVNYKTYNTLHFPKGLEKVVINLRYEYPGWRIIGPTVCLDGAPPKDITILFSPSDNRKGREKTYPYAADRKPRAAKTARPMIRHLSRMMQRYYRKFKKWPNVTIVDLPRYDAEWKKKMKTKEDREDSALEMLVDYLVGRRVTPKDAERAVDPVVFMTKKEYSRTLTRHDYLLESRHRAADCWE